MATRPRIYFDSIREYLVTPDRRGKNAISFERIHATYFPSSISDAAFLPQPAPIRKEESASTAMMEKLRDFYRDETNFDKLRAYLDRGKDNPVSLRILDFLCTENGIALQNDDTLPEKYQHMLKIYSKKFFDVFARGDRSCIELNGEKLQTTVGQLNFFRWAIQTGLLGRIKEEEGVLRDGIKKRKAYQTAAAKNAKKLRPSARVCVGGRFEPRVFSSLDEM